MILGMNQGDIGSIDELKKLPMLYVFHKLQKAAHNMPKSLNWTPVMNAQMDPYSSSVIAPDHLLARIVKAY